MKIAMRMLILTLALAAANLSNVSSFSGPGTPAPQLPPIAVA